MIRISEHQLHHLMARLSERAITVLRFLAQQRFATTSHLARLLRPHHTSPASALRQTSRLTKHWTAISFVDGSEKLELWFRLPSWFSPIPDGLRSGYGTRSRNEAWSDCNRVQSMMSPL